MNYNKPEVAVLGDAAEVVRSIKQDLKKMQYVKPEVAVLGDAAEVVRSMKQDLTFEPTTQLPKVRANAELDE